MQVPPDDRSAVAQAMDWASRIIAIALVMVLPGLGGYWLDGKFGTAPWLLLVGFVLGMVIATLQLIQMVAALGKQRKHKQPNSPPDAHD